jgi:hypothetical protein
MQTNSCDARSYAKNPRLDSMNWATSMAAARDSAADLPRVTRGRRLHLHRCDERRFGPVRFELFFGSFSLQWKSYCCHRDGAHVLTISR